MAVNYSKWILIKDAAKICGISSSRISQIIKNGWGGGKFRTAKDRGHTVIHPNDVEKFRKAKRKPGNPGIATHAQAAGRLGGKARAEKLSPKERSKISALGAKERWRSS